jgi:hypothetical protein
MKPFILSLLVAVTLASCTNYGKKVTIEGTKGEVFYKGSGVTEADAKKLCKYLKDDIHYFGADKKLSVQLMKSKDDGYDVRFVVNEKKLNESPQAVRFFEQIGAAMSVDLYNDKPVNIFLTDDRFKEIKSIPFDEAKVKALKEPASVKNDFVLSKDDFDHDAAGGVDFYWSKEISDEESKTIADYIVKNGSFSGGTAEIYMTKEGDRYILRFPMIESARTDPSMLAEVEKVSKEIKDNLFANVPYSFYATDEQMNTVKSWDY